MQKRKLWIGIVALVLVFAAVAAGLLLHEKQQRMEHRNEALEELERNAGQYDEQSIVLYDTSKAKAEELAELYGAELRITANGRFATLTLPEGTTIRDVYAMDESLKYIEEMAADYQVQVSELTEEEEDGERLPMRPQYSVSDTDYELQTYLDYLNMGTVWDSYTGSGITVAVIDTGIDTDHPEFAGRISEYSYNATEDKIVKDWLLEDGSYDWSLIEDEQGHGTAVTGVLAAAMDGSGIVGIAPNVNIIVIKAECDEKGNFERTSDLIYGLYYAIERDVQVVNMSFGTYAPMNPFEAATQLAYDSDIICVAAAGNETTSALCWPAADENVIGVGALGDGWELAYYSNFGENTDLVAPGTTYTCRLGGTYETVSGTSLASPVVAGTVALFLQNNPYVTFNDVTEVLYASGYDLGDLGRDWYYGFGALDVSAFILEERGTIHYDMLTDELENEERIFIQGHTLQELPEPERLYAVFDGWYYDDTFTQEYNYYEDKFYGEVTLYAKWVNEDDGIPYTYVVLDDGTVEIRSYTGHRRFITIPEKIEGRIVSSVGDFAFSGQTRLREVTLPSGLNHIGLYAFENCANLVSIHIPANVTEIEAGAFFGNVRLSTVAFLGNSKLETIGDFAFQNCARLERIELPASLRSINGSAFFGATALNHIGVQAGNTVFATREGVLFNYSGSTLVAFPAAWGSSYVLPEGTLYIGDYAFGYAQLTEVDLRNVQRIGGNAFAYAELQTLTVPDSVLTMGGSAFAFNENLTSLTIGRGLIQIPEKAFLWTTQLKTVTIPNGITVLNGSAFGGSGLERVSFEAGSTLTVIGDSAFFDCKLSEIDIPASVLRIGDGAFSGSFTGNPLVRVGFADDAMLHTIGNSAFAKCWLLETIDLPANLRTIGDFAFQSSGLTEVTIPAGVTTLGNGAFSLCYDLTAVTVEEGNALYHDIDGVVYTLNNTTVHTYPAGKAGESYTLENTTQIVAPWAFAGANNLVTAQLPEGLVQISEYGFAYCENMQYIHIPDNVLQIGRYSFAYDWDLHTVSFNETSKLPRISFGAFAYSGLNSFTVPANVSTMAQKAFEGCGNLTSITFAANSKLESISAYMFDGCSNLRNITFLPGSALTSIQAHGLEGMDKLYSIDFGDAKLTNVDNFAFRFCENLSTLNLPETVTNIGRYAFYGCKSLSQLTIPAKVEHIGSYAFLGTGDVELYFVSETLPQYLDEDWDRNVKGYYTGVVSVMEDGDYRYAVLESGNIAILEYLGEETHVDLNALDFGAPITVIGGSAFEGSSVQTIVLPDTLTAIQAEAFAYSALTSITIPANVTFIGREAFAYTDLTALTFAAGSRLSVMEQYAFAGTKYLTAVTLPKSLTTMGTGMFQESGLQSVTFEEGIRITEIPQKAFANTQLTGVKLPDSVTLVNHNAFNNVQTLKQVTFGNNEGIRLMSNAFYHTGLESLHIPANVTYIGEYCFVALNNLTEFSVDENNPNYTAVDGLLMTKSGRKLIAVPAGRTGSLTVPKSVEEIGFGAFEESKLSEILFHEDANILTFGYRAFFKANGITEITIPKSVVSIDYYAFAYCENLRTVTFAEDNQLKGIYEGAFLGCINLENITIPDSIVEISDFAFYGCSKITELPISENSQVKGIYDYAFAYTGLYGEFTTPETLIDIGNYAFLGTKLESVTIPDANKKDLIIGIGAFEDCNQLEEITLPFIGASYEDEDISWFGYIFGAGSYEANETYVPDSLKTVTLTEGITTIYTGGFAYCTSLETINVPHSVSMLYYGSFEAVTARYELISAISGVNGVLHSSCFGTGLTGNVTIAEGTTYLSGGTFSGCEYVTEITVPEGVAELGAHTFSGCTSLQKITLPSTLRTIEESVFMQCYSLKQITIPDSITEIGCHAFDHCTSLEEIYIPVGVTKIEEYTFYGCNSLRNICIPEGVKSIDYGAFMSARLPRIVIPQSVEIIEPQAFAGCEMLHEIENHSGLQFEFGSEEYGSIAYYAKVIVDAKGNRSYLDEQSGFTMMDTADHFRFIYENGEYRLIAYFGEEDTVTLPENINGCEYAIYGFSGAEHVIIPEGREVIDANAFVESTLVSVQIPDSVTSIGERAFDGCTSLQSISLPKNLAYIGYSAFGNCDSLEEIAIPDNVSFIEGAAFWSCDSLKHIVWPSSVSFIGDDMFHQCVQLQEVIIPEGVTSIGGYAFDNCIALTDIELPESLSVIHDKAFASSGLTHVKIPQNVETLAASAFSGCDIQEITIDSENPNFTEKDGVVYNKECTQFAYIPQSLTRIVIPATVNYIFGAFEGHPSLKEVYFEDNSSLDTIDYYAFAYCSNLEKVILPDGITTLGYGCFMNCTKLEYIDIPDSVEKIDEWAFGECQKLRELNIPANVEYLYPETFRGCVNLERITVDEANPYYAEYDGVVYNKSLASIEVVPQGIYGHITIHPGVTEIPQLAFYGCRNVTGVTLPDTVVTIGGLAFGNCAGMTNITLSNNLETIGDEAFAACSSLLSITLPERLVSVGYNAFGGCSRMVQICNNSVLDLEIGSEAFGGVAYYAKLIIHRDGSKTYGDPQTEFELIFTEDGFCFEREYGQYTLVAYVGEESHITLPLDINGNSYYIRGFLGGVYVAIPEGFTEVPNSAFSSNETLKGVFIPASVKTIGDSAFWGCSKLEQVTLSEGLIAIEGDAFAWCGSLAEIFLPSSIERLGWNVFRSTPLYTNASNWKDGCLMIDGHLIGVDPTVSNYAITEDVLSVSVSAFENCNLLKVLQIGHVDHNTLSYLSNLETLVLRDLNNDLYQAFGWRQPQWLKNVIILEDTELSFQNYRSLFSNITGITIYVEAMEEDLRWDDNFPGWSNGNKVVYGDDWHWVNFYDENGKLILSEPCLNAQIIRLPIHQIAPDERYTYEIIGWDLNGDGKVDSIPATSVVDINAEPVVVAKERLYTVQFADRTTGTVYHSVQLPYGAIITAPEDPTKRGYDFVTWSGLTDSLAVTGDVVIYASWKHHGDGHEYAESVWVEATCTEPGYYKHECTICGEHYGTDYTEPLGHEYRQSLVAPNCTVGGYTLYSCSRCADSYRDQFTPALGHDYGEWIVDEETQCEKQGAQHRNCSICGDCEEGVIPAKGHEFVVTDCVESTCDTAGKQSFCCADCGLTITEELPLKAHAYEKKYAFMSFLEWLIRLLMDVLWGYEGDRAYYYVCEDCGHVMSTVEAETYRPGVASTVCRHTDTTWITVRQPDCNGQGVEACVCDYCGEVLEAKAYGTQTNHSLVHHDAQAPTCTEHGWEAYDTCENCDYTTYVEIEATGHSYVDGACEHCGEADPNAVRMGDVNGDGDIDSRDAMLVMQYFVGMNSELNAAAADVNGDGSIDSRDAMLIMQYFVGILESFPTAEPQQPAPVVKNNCAAR